MRQKILLCALIISAMNTTPARAADLEAGRLKATTVCAACHGANGVSVADHIPNLAGQRAGYLVAQLEAFKDKSRKSDIMNVIAPQLTGADIANVTAHFAALPGASGQAKSSFLPNLAKTNVTFPANHKEGFTRYHMFNDAESGQLKVYFANNAAIAAAKAGKPLPNGAMILVEIYAAKLDANKKPATGTDGFYVPDRLLSYATMARDAGWGNDIPEMLRNDEWNYALFSADRKLRGDINQAECLACHKPESQSSYLFSFKALMAFGKR